MDNSINFKGAVIVRKPTLIVKKSIVKTIGKNRHIDNFLRDGDILYITRKSQDKDIADILAHHRAKFEYYPNLSIKSSSNEEIYNEAGESIVKSQEKPLTKRSELINYFKLNKFSQAFSTKKTDNPIEYSLRALGYNTENQVVRRRNGYSEVRNKDGQLLARISGPGQYGISFAYVEPKNTDESPLRYALRGGSIIFQYTSESGRAQFLKNYNNAVKANKILIKQ